jgi:hypothetical protein
MQIAGGALARDSEKTIARPSTSAESRGSCPGHGSREKRSADKRRPYVHYIVPAQALFIAIEIPAFSPS